MCVGLIVRTHKSNQAFTANQTTITLVSKVRIRSLHYNSNEFRGDFNRRFQAGRSFLCVCGSSGASRQI
jgi:hypothetical protein